MDAIEAIRERRMLPKVTDERPSREEIAELLELAVRAPNHHLTEPWRFHVLAGDAREKLAEAIATELIEGGASREEAIAEGRKKVGRAPVIIVVTCIPDEQKKGVIEQEEVVSTAMAIQNILLAAQAKGLGVMLRTGSVAYHPAAGKHLGLGPTEKVVGFLYVGYPAGDRSLTPRAPAAEKTTWDGWD